MGPRHAHGRCVVAVSTLLWLAGCSSVRTGAETPAGRFEVGLIGDQQYDAESEAKFPHLMSELNRSPLAFVVHVGDIGAPANGSCQDETFQRRQKEFQQSRHPFVYTPGDNEWTDCHDPRAGGFDPLERLVRLREVFFQGQESLGQRTVRLTRQSDDPHFSTFRENVRWTQGDVVFVTLHVVGSNNNLGRTPAMDAEYSERNAANLGWMKQAFALAKRNGSRAIMLFMQGNPGFEDTWPPPRIRSLRIVPPRKESGAARGYLEFLSALEQQVLAFDKPVVLVHGDTHYFRIDKPLFAFSSQEAAGQRGRVIEHFTRVELFGYPEAHWVRVVVDPSDPNLFTFKPELVKKNVVHQVSPEGGGPSGLVRHPGTPRHPCDGAPSAS